MGYFVKNQITYAIDKLQQAYTATRARNHANFVDVNKRIKALDNSNGTNSHTQIIIFGYGNISTITPDRQLIESTSTQTPAGIADPRTKLPHDGQIINHATVGEMSSKEPRSLYSAQVL
ncbi:hypothetical protein EV2_002447 [Malus domestica]